MEIDAITQFILAIVPAFTAVVGMITTLGVAIGKIKKANKETTDLVQETNKENVNLRHQLNTVMKENAELKKEQRKINAKLDHMYFIDKEE